MPALKKLLDGPYLLEVPWLDTSVGVAGHEPVLDVFAGPGLRFQRLVARFDEGGHLHPAWDTNVRGLQPAGDDHFSPSGRTLKEVLSDGLARIARFHRWTRETLLNEETRPLNAHFRVPDWEGTLQIPVDEIYLSYFGRRRVSGPAHCKLQLRPHLELVQVEIFSRQNPTFKMSGGFGLGREANCIQNEFLRAATTEALGNWGVREEVLRALQGKGGSRDFSFPLWEHPSDQPSPLRFTTQ
jgi:hypothetical protein